MKNSPSTEERIWAAVAHLSAIAMGMGLLLPVVGWSEQRRKSNYASFHCLQALGYQSLGYTVWILVTLIVLVFSAVAAMAGVANAEDVQAAALQVVYAHTTLMFGLIGVYLLLPVIAAIACALGKDFRYPILGARLARYLGYDPAQAGNDSNWLQEDHEDRWVSAMGHFSVIIMLWGMLVPLTAWIMQGKRSLFLRFQALQTLAFQVCVTLLFLGGIFLYMAGAFVFLGSVGLSGDFGFTSTASMTSLIVFLVFMLIVAFILLIVPLFHIMGQWAGYRVLKGADYLYPVVGKLIEKRLAKTDSAS